jgi:methylmalonyl-CoA mutase C-terminal domain/subunit
VAVFVGGIIPVADIAELKALGIAEVFTPGTPIESIVTWLDELTKNKS